MRKRNSRRSISKKIRFMVLARCKFKCYYCGKTAADDRIDIDHKIPVCAGGSDSINNLVAACTECNIGKSDLDLSEPETQVLLQLLPGFEGDPEFDFVKALDRIGSDMFDGVPSERILNIKFTDYADFERKLERVWINYLNEGRPQ